jgi:two-component system LytT family response regulator
MLKAIIIDDESSAREALKTDLVNFCNDIEVIAEAGDILSACKMINALQPDVVSLDIDLGPNSGFELLELFPEIKFEVIFVTASNQHAIRAFKFSALDYLMKPVNSRELILAVNKLHSKKTESSGRLRYNMLMEYINNANRVPDRMVLNTEGTIHVIDIKDIIHCDADGSYTHFYLNTNEKIVVSKNLTEYETMFEGHGFMRVHKSHLINCKYIKRFEEKDGGMIVMINNSKIPLATRKREEFFSSLKASNRYAK